MTQPHACLQQPALKFRFPGQRAVQQIVGIDVEAPFQGRAIVLVGKLQKLDYVDRAVFGVESLSYRGPL